MNVLCFHQYFCLPEGSSGTRSYEFSRRLVDSKHNVDIITSPSSFSSGRNRDVPYYKRSYQGINIHVCNIDYNNRMDIFSRLQSYGRFAYASGKVSKTISKPDIIFATSTPLTIGIPGIYAARYHSCPMVFEVRD